MVGARDVVVGLGLVGRTERERRLELCERARLVLRFEIQLARARVRRRLKRCDVEAEAQRFERTRAVALFETKLRPSESARALATRSSAIPARGLAPR